MKVYDLDINEDFDYIIIGEKEYKIGDVPVWVYEKIQKLKTTFSSDKQFIQDWKKIIVGMLELKNEDVDVSKISNKHIIKIIEIISDKIKKQDDYKKI